jgi:hypothetical protein
MVDGGSWKKRDEYHLSIRSRPAPRSAPELGSTASGIASGAAMHVLKPIRSLVAGKPTSGALTRNALRRTESCRGSPPKAVRIPNQTSARLPAVLRPPAQPD